MKKKEKGFTLLEILIALALFSVAMVFIMRLVQSSFRQRGKIRKNVERRRTLSNTLDLMKQDFQGAVSFFDMNNNLWIHDFYGSWLFVDASLNMGLGFTEKKMGPPEIVEDVPQRFFLNSKEFLFFRKRGSVGICLFFLFQWRYRREIPFSVDRGDLFVGRL